METHTFIFREDSSITEQEKQNFAQLLNPEMTELVGFETHFSAFYQRLRSSPPSLCWGGQTAPGLSCGCLWAHSSKQGKQVLDGRWVSLRSLLGGFSTRGWSVRQKIHSFTQNTAKLRCFQASADL